MNLEEQPSAPENVHLKVSLSRLFSRSRLQLGSSIALLIAMLVCIGAAWVAQSVLHVQTGGQYPRLGVYNLLGSPGVRLIERLLPRNPLYLYVAATAAFALLCLFNSKALDWSPGLLASHLDPEPIVPPRKKMKWGWKLSALAGAILFIALAIFSFAFTAASVRADSFNLPRDQLPQLSRILLDYYSMLGLQTRPNSWLPFVTWVAAMASIFAAIGLIGVALGYLWESASSCPIGWARRMPWEWGALALIVAIFTAGYLWRLDRLPCDISQSEGLIGLGAYRLANQQFKYNIFANDIQPYTSLIPRAIAVAIFGNRVEPVRFTTALTSGVGLIFVYLTLRGMMGAVASLLATALMAGAHVILHYSRMGFNNIDGMYWIFIIIYAFYQAEISPPGIGRNCKYFIAGICCGASFGLFTGAPLGAAVTMIMVARRALSQRDFFRSRGLGVALLFLGFAIAVLPFVLNPSPILLRQGDVSIMKEGIDGQFQFQDIKDRGIKTISGLLLYRLQIAMKAFHASGDLVGEFGTPFPLAGPLLAALSILGAGVLLLRFRSWISQYVLLLYVAGAYLGGAVLAGPYPPSSARLLMLMPAVVIAAGVAIQAVVGVASRVVQPWLKSSGRKIRRIGFALAGCLAAIGIWSGISETYTNLYLYGRFVHDDTLFFHRVMSHTTELHHFMMGPSPTPDYIYQFDIDGVANQGYVYNQYFLPNLVWKSYFIPETPPWSPSIVPINSHVMFIIHEKRMAALDQIRAAFPGGQIFRTNPLEFPNATSRYLIYAVYTRKR